MFFQDFLDILILQILEIVISENYSRSLVTRCCRRKVFHNSKTQRPMEIAWALCACVRVNVCVCVGVMRKETLVFQVIIIHRRCERKNFAQFRVIKTLMNVSRENTSRAAPAISIAHDIHRSPRIRCFFIVF